MSWVSYAKLQTLCKAMREKFVTSTLMIATPDKSEGVYLISGSDGLISANPVNSSNSAELALANNDSTVTYLGNGSLIYSGTDSNSFTKINLSGNALIISDASGGTRQIKNVAVPSHKNDAVNYGYVRQRIPNFSVQDYSTNGWTLSNMGVAFNSLLKPDCEDVQILSGFISFDWTLMAATARSLGYYRTYKFDLSSHFSSIAALTSYTRGGKIMFKANTTIGSTTEDKDFYINLIISTVSTDSIRRFEVTVIVGGSTGTVNEAVNGHADLPFSIAFTGTV